MFLIKIAKEKKVKNPMPHHFTLFALRSMFSRLIVLNVRHDELNTSEK